MGCCRNSSFFLLLAAHAFAVVLFMNFSPVHGMKKMPPPEAKLYPGFSRQCPGGPTDCRFVSLDSPESTVYFKCRENNICFCSKGDAPADVLVWPVVWENGSCLISKGGPCGEDSGIHVDCMSGLNCIQGRCRNATELSNGKVNQFCNDSLDCQPGLYCGQPAKNMEIRIKRCLSR